MQGKYSPTVREAYRVNQSWHDNILDVDGVHDRDGYDSYGYNRQERDRAGYTEFEYMSMGEDDFEWIATCWGFDGSKPVLLTNQEVEQKISAVKVPKMTVIEQVSQYVCNGFVYRFRTAEGSVTVQRVPEDQPYWHHGVIKEIYCDVFNRFVPTIKASSAKKFASIAEAIVTIGIK